MHLFGVSLCRKSHTFEYISEASKCPHVDIFYFFRALLYRCSITEVHFDTCLTWYVNKLHCLKGEVIWMNVVLYAKFLLYWKLQGVSERMIQKYLLISLVVHILERYGISTFFTDIGTFWQTFFKQNNIGFNCPVDSCL